MVVEEPKREWRYVEMNVQGHVWRLALIVT